METFLHVLDLLKLLSWLKIEIYPYLYAVKHTNSASAFKQTLSSLMNSVIFYLKLILILVLNCLKVLWYSIESPIYTLIKVF